MSVKGGPRMKKGKVRECVGKDEQREKKDKERERNVKKYYTLLVAQRTHTSTHNNILKKFPDE